MKKYFAEMAGTYLLVFLGTGSIVLSQSGFSFINHSLISISFGVSVFLMILLFGQSAQSQLQINIFELF